MRGKGSAAMERPSDRDPRTEEKPPAAPRPRYEPPRIEKKRSVARVTLFSGTGTHATGITGYDESAS